MNQQQYQLDYLLDQFNSRNFGDNLKQRLEQFVQVLNEDTINLKKLKTICSQGIPEDLIGLRSLCWKLLLGYLPPNKSSWKSKQESNYQIYQSFAHEFYNYQLQQSQVEDLLQLDKDYDMDNPNQDIQIEKILSQSIANINEYKQDQRLFEQIEKDTIRTRSELSFFQQQNSQILNQQFLTQISKERLKNNDNNTKNYDILTRMLYIYAKLNPVIKYVQGMNELLAPIFYIFHQDRDESQIKYAESDSFFCFTILMSEAKDRQGIDRLIQQNSFIQQMDSSSIGIKAKMQEFERILKKCDKELWEHLLNLKINSQFYSLRLIYLIVGMYNYRWILLYFTQEFELFDVLRLWDTILTYEDKTTFVLYVCVAILQYQRQQLLKPDFIDVMQQLLKYRGSDVMWKKQLGYQQICMYFLEIDIHFLLIIQAIKAQMDTSSHDSLRICVSECDAESRFIVSLDDVDQHYMHKYLKFSTFQQQVNEFFENQKVNQIQEMIRHQGEYSELINTINNVKKQLDELGNQLEIAVKENQKYSEQQQGVLQSINIIKSNDQSKLTKDMIDHILHLMQQGMEQQIQEWINLTTNNVQQINLLMSSIKQQALKLFDINQESLQEHDDLLNLIDNEHEDDANKKWQEKTKKLSQENKTLGLLNRDLNLKLENLEKQLSLQNEKQIELITPKAPPHKMHWTDGQKANKISMINPQTCRCEGSKWDCLAWFALAEPSITKIQQDKSIAIKCRFITLFTVFHLFMNMNKDDVSIGLVYKSLIEKKKYQTADQLDEIGHGCYMISCKGSQKFNNIIKIGVYSHSDQNINNKKKAFNFNVNEILTLIIDFKVNKLTFTNDLNSYSMSFVQDKNLGSLCFAVSLSGKGDQLELLN